MFSFISRLTGNSLLFSFILSTLFIAGCEDNPVKDDEEHAEPGGLILKETTGSENTILKVFDAKVTLNTVSVKQGTETDHLLVYFLAEDDSTKTFHPEGDEYSLSWDIADTSIVIAERHVHELLKASDDDEKWELVLVGKKAGTTTMRLNLNHGSHADFRTPYFNVTVTP